MPRAYVFYNPLAGNGCCKEKGLYLRKIIKDETVFCDMRNPETYATTLFGSTTVKLVILDEHNEMMYGRYHRHRANIQAALAELLSEAKGTLGECGLKIKITGSGSINLGKALGIEFLQEVAAVATALVTSDLSCSAAYS